MKNNKTEWKQLIKEELGVTAQPRLEWMSQYAINHKIFEAQQTPGSMGNTPVNSYPLNTLGVGNPMFPQANRMGQNVGIGNTGADFHSPEYQVGSGDVPGSSLPIALTVAAQTIAFDLVAVVPTPTPLAVLQYFETPYAGGKLGALNETSFDGKGADSDNKPIYIKIKGSMEMGAAIAKHFKSSTDAKDVIIAATYDGTTWNFEGKWLQNSRIDNAPVIKVTSVKTADFATRGYVSIAEFFTAVNAAKAVSIYSASAAAAPTVVENKIDIVLGTDAAVDVDFVNLMPDLVDGYSDHVQEFQNFSTLSADQEDPMTRAENETGVGNTVAAHAFTMAVQVSSFEVTGSVTRQQLQDMPLYGIDVVGKVLEQMQNRLSQAINNRILKRLFELGCTNAEVQASYQNVNLNLNCDLDYDGTTPVYTSNKMKDVHGNAIAIKFNPLTDRTSTFNNYTSMQRRISSRVLAASNIIANVTRLGRGSFIVTNTQIVTALQDCAGFIVAPMENTLKQSGDDNLYFAGTLAGMSLYVDPNMDWDDCRILVGRKSNGSEPGVIFMPYILADTVRTTAEGTMAPKLVMNSRFAIVDAGFYPEQSYFTFEVKGTDSII